MQVRKSLQLIGIWTSLVFILVAGTSPVRADDSSNQVGISLTPAQAALSVNGGETTAVILHVTNTTKHAATFTADLDDYTVSSANELTFFDGGTQTDSLASFIQLTPTRFELAAGASATVTARFNPSTKQITGRYRGAIVVGPAADLPVPQSGSKGAAIAVTGKVAALVGVTVKDSATKATVEQARYFKNVRGGLSARSLGILIVVLLAVVLVIISWRRRKHR